jgi:hypothetical protein
MDEKFADQGAPPPARVTSLTGVLIPTEVHRVFRARFYRLVLDALGEKEGVIQPLPAIHASNLLPGAADETRFAFLNGLVNLVTELKFQIYRIGYRTTPEILAMTGGESRVIGLCFSSMLFCLEKELASSAVWPVMEIDRTSAQDRAFAGLMQNIDYITACLGPQIMSISNENLGEVLYTTKRSAYGSVVDCVAYLLHLGFLSSIGHFQTPFKTRIAEIASGVRSIIAFDEVIELRFEQPPAGYIPSGPIRFAVPIKPQD